MNILRDWYDYYLRSNYGDRVGIIFATMMVIFLVLSILCLIGIAISHAPIVCLVIAQVVAAVLLLARLPRDRQR